MDTATAVPRSERLLTFAHQCISGALQFDYLSSGAGQRQTTPVRRPRATSPVRTGNGLQGHDLVRQYLAEVATRQRLSSTEEYCLVRAARSGDTRARLQLIEHQLGLVIMIARGYREPRLPLLDLIEEGNIGLMIALEKFDPERGCRFSTYAKWWIRQSIDLALMTQADVVHIPIQLTRELRRQSRSRARVAASADSPQSDAPMMRRTAGCLLHDVRNYVNPNQAAEQDELQALLDTIAAPEHEQPDWHVQMISRRNYLEAALLRLRETEQLVLRARFGLVNDIASTLHELARQLNLSTERVRQIQTEALGKLRRILQAAPGPSSEDLL